MMSDFRDFPSQDSRKKVDLQNMENAADKSQHRDKDLSESRSVFDLRKSLAWDSAFFDSPGVLDPEELCETVNIQLVDSRQGFSGSRESAKANTFSNLRKSLAWDNAFFTSAGVLDAEELSIVNRGFTRPDLIQFPDEILQSPKLNSVVNTNGYSLASLEIDLFDDVRSSLNGSSSIATSRAKLESRKGNPDNRALKTSTGSSQVQHGAPKGESSSSRKPPKISSHSNPSRIVPGKRPSQVNQASKSANGKKMCLRESCNASLKSPSSVLSACRNYHPGLRYASVDLINRSPANPRRRMAASISSFKTPSKYSTKNKSQVANSSDSIRLFSTPKTSPFTSPGSSIDTSSSLTRIKQKYLNSSAASDASKTSKSCFRLVVGETKLLDPRTKVSRNLTPSGLRMPSPKLGYFDDERSVDFKFQSNRSTNVRRYMSRPVKNDEGKLLYSNEKQGLKENKLCQDNKENVIMENNVGCLTRHIGAMTLTTDSVIPEKRT